MQLGHNKKTMSCNNTVLTPNNHLIHTCLPPLSSDWLKPLTCYQHLLLIGHYPLLLWQEISSMYNEGIGYPLRGSLACEPCCCLLLAQSWQEMTHQVWRDHTAICCIGVHPATMHVNQCWESKTESPCDWIFFFFTLHHKTFLESGQKRMKTDPFNTSVLI